MPPEYDEPGGNPSIYRHQVQLRVGSDVAHQTLAAEVWRRKEELLEVGWSFARGFFHTPGTPLLESVTVPAEGNNAGDFAFRCTFSPESRNEDFTYVYFDFVFSAQLKRTGAERFRCVQFVVGLW